MGFFYKTSLLNLNNIKTPSISFRSNSSTYIGDFNPQQDSFATNPLRDKFSDKHSVEIIAKSNPEIMRILREYKIPLKVNMQALEDLKRGHLMDTRVTVAKMYSALPANLKAEVNLSDLQQAAMLHDYGKALIPENILNKDGELEENEKEIMSLHSELSYELLKNQGVNKNVLNLIKYHHQKPDGSGYPVIDENFEYSLANEILTVADKYSALREKRSYKSQMSHQEALAEIHKDVENGIVSQEVFNALVKMV